MDYKLKISWEIANIKIDEDNETNLLQKFIIYDDSKLIQSPIFKITKTDNIINTFQNSQINTGIMII